MNISLTSRMQLATWLAAFLVVPLWRGGRDGLGYLIISLTTFLIFVLLRYKTRYAFQFPKQIAIPLLAFFAFSALSLFWAADPFTSSLRLLNLAGVGLYLVALSQIFMAPRLKESFVTISIYASLPIMAYGLYLYLATVFDRAASSFYAPNPYALYLLIISILVLYKLNKHYSRVLVAILSLLISQFILTQSLATSALAVVFVSAVTLFAPSKNPLRTFKAIIVAGIIGALIAFGITSIKNQVGEVSIGTPDGITQLVEAKSSGLEERFLFWGDSIEILEDNPWLGVGLDNFQTVYSAYQDGPGLSVESPHNIYLQSYSELGVIGGSILLIFTLGLLKFIITARRDYDLYLIAGGLLVFFAHASFYQTNRYPSLTLLFVVLLALLISNQKKILKVEYSVRRNTIFALIALALVIPSSLYFRSNHFEQRAQDAYALRNIEDATLYYEKALSQKYVNPDVFSQLALMEFFAGNIEDAKYLAAEGVKRDPEDAQHYAMQAFLEQRAGSLPEAARLYEQAIARDPNNLIEMYTNYARVQIDQSNLDQARIALDSLLPKYNDQVVKKLRGLNSNLEAQLALAHFQRARIAALDNDLERMRTELNRTLELRPAYGPARSLLDSLNQNF